MNKIKRSKLSRTSKNAAVLNELLYTFDNKHSGLPILKTAKGKVWEMQDVTT
jgi:hypothetical protein